MGTALPGRLHPAPVTALLPHPAETACQHLPARPSRGWAHPWHMQACQTAATPCQLLQEHPSGPLGSGAAQCSYHQTAGPWHWGPTWGWLGWPAAAAWGWDCHSRLQRWQATACPAVAAAAGAVATAAAGAAKGALQTAGGSAAGSAAAGNAAAAGTGAAENRVAAAGSPAAHHLLACHACHWSAEDPGSKIATQQQQHNTRRSWNGTPYWRDTLVLTQCKQRSVAMQSCRVSACVCSAVSVQRGHSPLLLLAAVETPAAAWPAAAG